LEFWTQGIFCGGCIQKVDQSSPLCKPALLRNAGIRAPRGGKAAGPPRIVMLEACLWHDAARRPKGAPTMNGTPPA